MSIVAVEGDRFKAMEQVAELTMKGHSATAISKELNIPRKEVMTLQEDYRIALSNDAEARNMAKDYLNMMVKHYDGLIKKFYELSDDIDTLTWSPAAAAQKNAALKAVAELERNRLDALQKAGLLESSELGDEIAQWEDEKDTMLSVLEDLCTMCSAKVGERMLKLRGGIVVEHEVVEGEIV